MATARGYIVPVGGAEEKMGDVAILRRFAALCGGEKCRVAIIPTASMLSETGARYEQLFRDLGVKHAQALPDCHTGTTASGRNGWTCWTRWTGCSSPAATSSGSAP